MCKSRWILNSIKGYILSMLDCLKLSGGRFKNETTMENKNFFFIGIGTGIQPIIAKRIAVRLSSDMGYMRNGLSETLLFNDGSDPFNSGFAVIFNLGIGIKF